MSCTKLPYPSPDVARRVVKALRRRKVTRRRLSGIHPCAIHHTWHVTSHRVKKKWRVR